MRNQEREQELRTRNQEPRTRKYVRGYGFLSFARKLSNKYGKQLSDTANKTGLDALKTASQKVVHKAAEATGEIILNKITDKIVKPGGCLCDNLKPKFLPAENLRSVEKIVIPPEKRQEILNELKQVL